MASSEATGGRPVLPRRYGPWAVIAGASVGLGAAFAHSAARRGFHVVLIARRAAALQETACAVERRYGVRTRCLTVDLGTPDAGDVIAAETADLDVGVLVYNAAAEPAGRFLDVPLEEHRVNIAVNCWTPTVLAHRLGGRMVERGRGAVAIVSSMAALQGIKMFASYGAAKAYELILAEGLWDEFRDRGVDVLGYVVGATASPTFDGARPDAFGEAGGATAAGRILAPSAPEEVAERLFDRLSGGPRQFSHDADEANAAAAAQKPRADAVAAMGDITTRLSRFN